mgnify:CR=1 FL=1
MAAFEPTPVRWVRHWNDRLFSFATERAPEFRFENGHFTMVGLKVGDRPALRTWDEAFRARPASQAVLRW